MRQGVLLVTLVLPALAMSARPAVASCAGPIEDLLEDLPVVFIGTVIEERVGYGRMEVEQVWQGPDLAPQVWVQGGQDQPPWPARFLIGVAGSGDIDFSLGDRYLVASDSSFRTNDCIAQPMTEERLAQLAPSEIREPAPDGLRGADPPLTNLAASLRLAALVVGSALLVRRWRRRRRGERVV